MRESYYWDHVLEPLVNFLHDPVHAPDLIARGVAPADALSVAVRAHSRQKKHGLRHDLRMVVYYMRDGGPGVVAKKIRRRLGRG